MNVYDKADDLARAIKESNEFDNYKKAAEKIEQNEEHKKMIKDFMNIQYKFYMAQMQGQEPDESLVNEYNVLYTTISNLSDIKDFLENQMYFARMMEDVQKVIAGASDTGLDFLNELVGS